MARRARRQAGDGLERPRHHPRLRHQHRARGRHGVRLRRRQSGDLRRQIGVRLAPAARAQQASPSAASRAALICSPKPDSLEGRRATLHWEHLPAFREAFPDVTVVPSLFEIDCNRITCSGGISALDMMVALIERDHGRQLAAIGRRLVPAHPCARGLRSAAHGSPLSAGRSRREAAHRAARHGDEHRDADSRARRWRARPASRSGSSSGCSIAISAMAFTRIIAGCGWSGRASCCARPRSPCSTWRSPPASALRASSPAPMDRPSASRRAAPA